MIGSSEVEITGDYTANRVYYLLTSYKTNCEILPVAHSVLFKQATGDTCLAFLIRP